MQTFERRSRYVKEGTEMEKWNEVTPDMMSDEERRGDVYIRHQPDYRSQRFNYFMEKLDERGDRKTNVIHARFKRKIGSPQKEPLPKGLKSWMVQEPAANFEHNESSTTSGKDERSEEDEPDSIEY